MNVVRSDRSIIVTDRDTVTFKSGEKLEFQISYFRQLTSKEQDECLRILEETDYRMLQFISSRIDYSARINGFTYVVENMKRILALPHDDDSDVSKFLMIASLNNIKWLNERNMNIFFAMRQMLHNSFVGFFVRKHKMSFSLASIIMSGLSEVSWHTGKISPMRWYIETTVSQWISVANMPLREIVFLQHSINETSILKPLFLNPSSLHLGVLYIIDTIMNKFDTGLIAESQVWSLFKTDLADFDGLMNTTFTDFIVFNQLCSTYQSNIYGSSAKPVVVFTLKEFFDKFPCSIYDVDKKAYDEAVSSIRSPQLHTHMKVMVSRFVYAFFEGDKEMFIEWETWSENNLESFTMDKKQFLNLLFMFKNDSDDIPLSLLAELV